MPTLFTFSLTRPPHHAMRLASFPPLCYYAPIAAGIDDDASALFLPSLCQYKLEIFRPADITAMPLKDDFNDWAVTDIE